MTANNKSRKKIREISPALTDHDIYLFKEGNHFKLYNKLGAHITTVDGVSGTYFAVWAPNAQRVSVVGDFNSWTPDAHPMNMRSDGSGIWELFIPHIAKGALYKYHIASRFNNYHVNKSDPYAFLCQTPPLTASVVWDLDYEWNDQIWMRTRNRKNAHTAPMAIYEVHLGSWKRVVEENSRSLTYREIAHELARYVKEMGFTHVELMPVMEHPFYASWGYQITGYFAPTSRYGTPQDFMYLIDHMHQNGIGVILDWVPSHFSKDEHGLVYFDGTHLYEHENPKKGYHPDWQCYIFNYGRTEVKEFLINSALYWLDRYHIDGLRVDAVASMLYLDYSRKNGEWIPNEHGGKENLDAMSLIKKFNEVAYHETPHIQTIAEESTAWPMVSRPTNVGGLGFGMKWNMGWMHDTLVYFSKDPIHRKFHHNQLTFSLWYAFCENFVLSLSHDEVVHGKRSLLEKMPGDDWRKFANLRLLFGYMYGYPGKKLLFMGDEFGQRREWNHDASLDWHLLEQDKHRQVREWLSALIALYRTEPALNKLDFDPNGFEWMNMNDWEQSTISFIRKGKHEREIFLVLCNFTPIPRMGYRTACPVEGMWKEVANSDRAAYGGSGIENPNLMESIPAAYNGKPCSLTVNLPPLGVLFLKFVGSPQKKALV